jgi:hypothetical protein
MTSLRKQNACWLIAPAIFAQIQSATRQRLALALNPPSLSPLAMQLILPLRRQQDPVMIRHLLQSSVEVTTMESGYV